jgi:hypothetical protein
VAQIRNFIVRQKQFEAYNDFRREMRGEALCSKGHLLVMTRNRDFTPDYLRQLHSLVANGYSFSHIDCSTLFDPTRNNPYEMLYEELCATGKHVFCPTNPGSLLSTGGKVIVKKIVEKFRIFDDEYLLWMCGPKSDIEAVLNMFPSLAAFFTGDHRLEQETPKDFEQVHAFFAALKDECLYCSIEAMDGLAHALLEGCRKGILSTWTVDDIQRFVVEQVKPRYLARCYQEISDEHLPQLELCDLCLDQLTSIESTYEQCLKDLDAMVEANPAYASVVKLVTVDVIVRAMRQTTTGEPMSQESQSALGYSWSGTYAIPGGGISGAIMKNDLKRLGLRRQQIGVYELWGASKDET